MRPTNLTLMTDLYELTMMQGYFRNPTDQIVVFDAFYRTNPYNGGYAIACGLDQVIEYIKNLHFTYEDIQYLRSLNLFDEGFLDYLSGFHFTGDIWAIPEGTVMFPREPMLKVIAPIMEAQLIEPAVLNMLNHQSLIATKASRVCYAAKPVLGTHAHSWIMSFPTEYEAFRAYAKVFPNNCILLVDTYDVLDSGVPNAIRVFKEMKEAGIPLKHYGIRIDSGDLAYLSKKAYKMLADAGFADATICASSDLDEFLIQSLKEQGAKINSWGVGTALITSKGHSSFGGVYKLAAVKNKGDKEFTPKIKLSENTEKITNPGNKKIYRIYDKESGKIRADLICLEEETFREDQDLVIFDPVETWKKTKIKAGQRPLPEGAGYALG